jgi:hypothetical protein
VSRATTLLDRLGPRTNVRPGNNASWLVALAILAVVIPASETVAANQVFFAAHGVSPLAWIVLLVIVVGLGWLVLWGLLVLARRRLSARGFDIVASALMLVITWFLAGNILSRTLVSGAPTLGPVLGLVVAVLLTLLARRVAMGTVLVAFAGAAAALPLVLSLVGTSPESTATGFGFEESEERPDVVWVVSDELQYPLVFDSEGRVRPEFPNLAALADDATTYTRAYAGANYTDYAVPAMLSGIADVAAAGPDRMQDVRAGLGIVPGLASEYTVVMESPIYSFDCESEDCATVGTDADAGFWERYVSFAADTAAIAGRTALAAPFSDLFPSLDGKWRDFWSGGDEFGDGAEGDSVGAVIGGIEQAVQAAPEAPVLAFWHTIRTHAPWVVDRDGRQIYPSRVPIVEGAHMIGAEADQTYTTDELKLLQRRLYADSAVDFDRQLGELVSALKASGRYEDAMIIVTADHGATMTERADRRVGDDLVQRWSEVAHVPLVVKSPGQDRAEVVAEPRSTGQIAASVLQVASADPGPEQSLAPSLDEDLAAGPVFTTVAGGVLTPWVYEGIAEVDPWRAEDLTPVDAEHPYAVGLDPVLLGGGVPADAVPVGDVSVVALPGDSDQQVLIVDRSAAACPIYETVGLVSVGGTVVGSVLWEGPDGGSSGQMRGWAIVPRADVTDYRFWCSAGQ